MKKVIIINRVFSILKSMLPVALVSLANAGSMLCAVGQPGHLSGYNLKSCQLGTPERFSQIKLDQPRLIKEISLSTRAMLNVAPIHYVVTVDDKLCGEKVMDDATQIFTITCKDNGVRGSVIKWTTKSSLPPNFTFCAFNICGEPLPPKPKPTEIDLIGYPSKQSSNWSPDRLAPRANDGDPTTCTVTQPYLPGVHQPWWEVNMGGNVTVHSVKITNYNHMLMNRLGNVVVTVDGHLCGPKLVDGNHLHVKIDCPNRPTGQRLRIQLKNAPKVPGVLTLCEVNVFGVAHGVLHKNKPEPDTYTAPRINLIGHKTSQSSTLKLLTGSKYAIDNDVHTCTQTKSGMNQPWWAVDLGGKYTVHYIKVVNRVGFLNRLGNVVVTVDGKPCGPKMIGATDDILWVTCEVPPTGGVNPTGSKLKIQLIPAPKDGILTLCEVEVYGFPAGSEIKPTPTRTVKPEPEPTVTYTTTVL